MANHPGARHDEVKCFCGAWRSRGQMQQHVESHYQAVQKVKAEQGASKNKPKKLTLRDITPGRSVW